MPSTGGGLKRLEYRIYQWDVDFMKYLKGLEKTKPVIVAGDLNVAHHEIDIYNSKYVLKRNLPGYQDEER